MNVASRISAVTVAVMSLSSAAVAQTPTVAGAQQATIVRMVATPASLTLQTGQSVDLTITAYDSSGAVITTTEAALFEWCERAGTPEFRQISALAKETPPPTE